MDPNDKEVDNDVQGLYLRGVTDRLCMCQEKKVEKGSQL